MPEFFVVIVEPKYEGNIGGIARVMKNFGFSKLVLVNPPKLGQEAKAMAMHGYDILQNAIIYDSFQKVIDEFDYLAATTSVIATDSNSRRNPVFPEDLAIGLDAKGRVALVFGREDHGLSNEEIAACDFIVTIPANPEYPTLNLSQSVTVILYEVSRQMMRKDSQNLRKFRRLEKVEKDHLLEKYDALVETIYENEFEVRIAKKTFRQVLGRAFVSGKEACTLMGVFRNAKRLLDLRPAPRLSKRDAGRD
jgi:tRNA/rRNA methyltransferase